MPLSLLILIGVSCLVAGLPILLMASLVQNEEEQRRKIGRCHFCEE